MILTERSIAPMKQLRALVAILLLVGTARAQSNFDSGNYSDPTILSPIRPSLAVITTILSIMFFAVFVILAYVKFCRGNLHHPINPNLNSMRWSSRFSGIDRRAIESLPFFQFSSLKGSKEGLECSVCLSKFQDSEILRLLPECKHAFHMSCIDSWLDGHSSCPLCRRRFDARDFLNFSGLYSKSTRFSRNPSNLSEDVPGLELFIQREEDLANRSSRRINFGSSFRLIEHNTEEGESLTHEIENIEQGVLDTGIFHKFKHTIIVSEVAKRNRWSDVNSSDLIFLNSEMLGEFSSQRFYDSGAGSGRSDDHTFTVNAQMTVKIKEDIMRKRLYETKLGKLDMGESTIPSSSTNYASPEEGQSRLANSSDKRSMSEITNLSRFTLVSKNRSRESSFSEREDRTQRLWLSIVHRTLRGFAHQEKNYPEEMDKHRKISA